MQDNTRPRFVAQPRTWRALTPWLNQQQLDDLIDWERGGMLDHDALLRYAKDNAAQNMWWNGQAN